MSEKITGPEPRQEYSSWVSYKIPKYKAEVKLNSNECPYPMPRTITAQLKKAAEDLAYNRYPDPDAVELKRQIAGLYGCSPEMVLAGNGSNEVIMGVFRAFAGAGRKVGAFPPSYLMTETYSFLSGSELVNVNREADYGIGESQIRKMVEARPEMLFLINPNNPTGTLIEENTIETLLKAMPSTLVLLDEAYGEFSRETMVPKLEKYPNLAISRTFSKAYSLAGLRVGYLLALPETVAAVSRAMLPYRLNAFSQAAAVKMIENKHLVEAQVDEIVKEREEVYRALAEIPELKTFPSRANFIWFRPREKGGTEVFEALYERGVLVRSFAEDARTPGFLRVTIGTPDENRRFVKELKEVMSE